MIYNTIFKRLQKLGIINQEGKPVFHEHVKLVHKPYMDLSIDYLGLDEEKPGAYRISMAHNFVQNGDLMADPDMEIRIYPALQGAEALTYQLDSLGVYHVVYPEPGKVIPKYRKELNSFLNQWCKNLIDQGFYLPQKPEDVPGPTVEKPEKKLFGRGLTVEEADQRQADFAHNRQMHGIDPVTMPAYVNPSIIPGCDQA